MEVIMNAEAEFERLREKRDNPTSSTYVLTGVNDFYTKTDADLAAMATHNVTFRQGLLYGVVVGLLFGATVGAGIVLLLLKVKQ